MFARILQSMANFQKGKSNWRFIRVEKLEIQVEEMSNDDGVGKWISLPKHLEAKKALINPKNTDNKYFKWCVTRAFFPRDFHPERVTDKLREQSNSFDWDGLSFPVGWRDIDSFERKNDISVNVFGWLEYRVYIARKTRKKGDRHVNLLLLKTDGKEHFCWIKNLSRLLREKQQKNERFYCDSCLNPLPTEDYLEKHKEFCETFGAVKTIPPKQTGFMKFKNFRNQTPMPFRIYADSEAILKPVSGTNGEFQQHIPCGFCFHTVSETNEVFLPVLIRGKNCVEEFVDKLVDHVRNLQNKKRKRIIWKEGEREKFREAKLCWFCGGDFLKTGKVADHCHFTGRFRGAAHPDCNLKATRPRITPVFFHNLANYDSHLFIKALWEKNMGKSNASQTRRKNTFLFH